MSMLYSQDLRLPSLLKDEAFINLQHATTEAIAHIKDKQRKGLLPVLDLPYAEQDIQELQGIAHQFHYADIFVLGTGGSSLGGRSLCDLTQPFFCRHHSNSGRRVHFLDNIDPHTMEEILKQYDLRQVGFLVISKSGSTAETLCQFLIVLGKALTVYSQQAIGQHFMVITEPTQNPLRTVAERYGIPVLAHHPLIGGRFSVLSLVGLLPALFAGVEVKAVRRGAQQVLDEVWTQGSMAKAALGAAWAVYMMQQKLPIMVMMPYCDRLKSFSDWYRQLWAESLGKQGLGSTPVSALGTVDQHSQLQLFLDGPKDKAYTLLLLDYQHKGEKITVDIADIPGLHYLRGRTIGDLMAAEQQATAQTLLNRGCPLRLIYLSDLQEEVLGALLMHFMLETMIAAELIGIDAYNQPAVEESKVLTRHYLTERLAS
jgi:glucose-6-phosphate isomerase